MLIKKSSLFDQMLIHYPGSQEHVFPTKKPVIKVTGPKRQILCAKERHAHMRECLSFAALASTKL